MFALKLKSYLYADNIKIHHWSVPTWLVICACIDCSRWHNIQISLHCLYYRTTTCENNQYILLQCQLEGTFFFNEQSKLNVRSQSETLQSSLIESSLLSSEHWRRQWCHYRALSRALHTQLVSRLCFSICRNVYTVLFIHILQLGDRSYSATIYCMMIKLTILPYEDFLRYLFHLWCWLEHYPVQLF